MRIIPTAINTAALIKLLLSFAEMTNISGNAVYSMGHLDSIFTDAVNGDYTIADMESLKKTLPGFEEIPLEKIGRQQKTEK